jgi:Taurine catabolism dioxygenase TauD, TfdA family
VGRATSSSVCLWLKQKKKKKKKIKCRNVNCDLISPCFSNINVLLDLEEFGITIIEDVGKDPLAIRTLSKRIGFLKLTHYGVDFVVKSKVDANNAAYTSKTLGLHVDLPYYENLPGVRFYMSYCSQYCNGCERILQFKIVKIISLVNKSLSKGRIQP